MSRKTFRDIVLEHYARYPLMRAQDYIKLAFQHFMGPGHMARERGIVEERLSLERPANETGVRYEDIGNGLVRCYLSGSEGSMTNEQLAEEFMITANNFVKNREGLENALEELTEMAKKGEIGVTEDEFRSLAEPFRAAGCPLISHSEQYNRAYKPHYRVIYGKSEA